MLSAIKLHRWKVDGDVRDGGSHNNLGYPTFFELN